MINSKKALIDTLQPIFITKGFADSSIDDRRIVSDRKSKDKYASHQNSTILVLGSLKGCICIFEQRQVTDHVDLVNTSFERGERDDRLPHLSGH